MNHDTKLEIVSGSQKKDPSKRWEALKITVGDWTLMHFPKTKFEMDYIKNKLSVVEVKDK